MSQKRSINKVDFYPQIILKTSYTDTMQFLYMLNKLTHTHIHTHQYTDFCFLVYTSSMIISRFVNHVILHLN